VDERAHRGVDVRPPGRRSRCVVVSAALIIARACGRVT
jgi:hypothetical protein